MNAIDGAVAALVGAGAAFGALRGFVSQLARLLALAGGLVVARLVAPELSALVRAVAPSIGAPLDRFVAFLIAFAAFSAAVLAGGRSLQDHLRRSALAPLDRLLGSAFGAAKGVLLSYVALFAVLCLPIRSLAREVPASACAPLLLRAIGMAAPLFPPEFEARGRATAREIEYARSSAPRTGSAGERPAPCATGAEPGR